MYALQLKEVCIHTPNYSGVASFSNVTVQFDIGGLVMVREGFEMSHSIPAGRVLLVLTGGPIEITDIVQREDELL